MTTTEPSRPKLPSELCTVFTHPSIARYGQIIVWDGVWSWARVCFEIELRELRAHQYLAHCAERRFFRLAGLSVAAWLIVWWL